MEIKVSEKGGYRIIALVGEFNLYNVRELKETLFSQITSAENNIIINMKQVSYMDSNAIGVLYAAQKKLMDMNKELYLSQMSVELADVMRIVGLNFSVIDTDKL
ncbi:MAG: STAS domain-containing protein [Spirochaetes bacterium]|nr:STAS domain-containing protein [Spirochaetota bacterium]HPA72005.1 STAS domain-containing protein [Spirochaetota bacterium]